MVDPEPLVQRLGYVAYRVRDLDAAIRFYEKFAHLELTRRVDGTAYLRGGTDHHWLVLEEAPEPGLERVGYEAVDEDAYAELRKRLVEQDITSESSEDALSSDFVTEWVRFRDPDGYEVEVYPQMVEMPTPVTPKPVRLVTNLHAVLRVEDPVASTAFYQRVLGFQVSDWVERWGSFMRCGNQYHHSLAVFKNDEFNDELDHFCMLVEDIDDVMRGRQIALSEGIKLRNDVLRHAASGGVGVYIVDEQDEGLVFEFATWHAKIEDEAHRPRILPRSPTTFDLWSAS